MPDLLILLVYSIVGVSGPDDVTDKSARVLSGVHDSLVAIDSETFWELQAVINGPVVGVALKGVRVASGEMSCYEAETGIVVL